MSTISCPRCGSAFPLAQVAQFDQFTCGACGAIVPVPIASPAPLPPQPQARPAAAPIPMPRPAAPAPRPAAAGPRPAPAPAPAPIPRPAAGPASRPAVPAPRPVTARPEAPPPTVALPPSALRAQHAKPSTPAPAPAPARAAARPAAPAPIRVAEPIADDDDGDEDDSPRGRRGARGGRDDRKKKSPMPLVLAGVGVLALVVGGVIVAKRGGKDPADAGTGGGAAEKPVVAADPDKDPAAWKALSAEDRKARAQMKAVNVDAKQESQAKAVFDFLMARDEKEIALNIARDVAKARPDVEWPHLALGHQDLRDLYEKTVRENPWSDGLSTDPMVEFQRMKKTTAPKAGPWWGDDETQKRVAELVARIQEEEKSLAHPFGQGVAKWVNYHKSIDVMGDYPAIHQTVGPYLIFVSLPVPKDKIGKATIADVSPEDVKRGKEILARTVDLYNQYYEAWYQNIGTLMGFEKHTQENTVQETTLLVNVFTSAEDYQRYVARTGGPGDARAYYSLQEPRFITTYDGKKAGDKADPLEDPEQVQCHEGTHQLVHLYTWETTKKSTGKKPEWLACRNRKLWFEEGFSEFCGAYRKEGDKFVFFVPLEERLADLAAIGEVVKERGWEDWRLKEVIDPNHSGQLTSYAVSRVRRPGEEGLAHVAMANLYYAKAWSLVYFLWNYESGGSPKYKDTFVKFIKDQFTVKFMKGSDNVEHPILVDAKAFRAAFGLVDDKAFQAFEKEWKTWEASFVESHRTPAYATRREFLRKAWGLDKDPAKAPDKK